MTTKQRVIRTKTIISADGILRLSDSALVPGDHVEVIVLLPEKQKRKRQSVLDILAQAPGKRIFKVAEDVEKYVAEERSSWDR